jgi:hypothetical protein
VFRASACGAFLCCTYLLRLFLLTCFNSSIIFESRLPTFPMICRTCRLLRTAFPE